METNFTVELDKNKMIGNVINEELDKDDVLHGKELTVTLTEAQLNTIVVSLGLLSMEEIVEDAVSDYNLQKENLALSHHVYDYLLTLVRAKLNGDAYTIEELVEE